MGVRRGSFVFVFLVGILVLYPFFSAAQEQRDAVPLPSFSFVTPLEKDIVSGVTLVITSPPAGPDGPDVRLSFLVDGARVGSFSSPDYSFSWDSSSVEDGSHALGLEYCLGDRCGSQSINVDVRNAPDLVIERAEERASVGSGVSSPVADSVSTPAAPPSSFFFTPANGAGAFILSDSSGKEVVRSSGGPVSLLEGTYSANLRVFDWPADEIILDSFPLNKDSTGVFGSLDVVRDSFAYSGDTYVPLTSFSVQLGVVPQLTRFRLPYADGHPWFWCQSLDVFSGRCQSPLPLEVNPQNGLVALRGDSMVVVQARSFGRTNPSAGGLIHVTPVNVEGASTLIDEVQNAFVSRGEGVDVLSGAYSLHSELNFPISGLDVQGLRLDSNGTIFSFSQFPATAESLIVSITPGYPFRSGTFNLDPSLDGDNIQRCSQWNAVAQECSSEWVPSSDRHLDNGVTALRLWVKAPAPADVRPYSLSDAQLLHNSVSLLQYVQSNSAFFDEDLSESPSSILSTLFTKMEISLDCGTPEEVVRAQNPLLDSGVGESEGLDAGDPLTASPSFSPDPVPSFLPERAESPSRVPEWRNPNWEGGISNAGPGEQEKNFLSCGKVSLQHVMNEVSDFSPYRNIVNVGDLFPHVKQSMVLTNASDVEQVKIVNIRLWARPYLLATEESTYDAPLLFDLVRTRSLVESDESLSPEGRRAVYSPDRIHNEVIEFRTRNDSLVGRYDYSDYWIAGLSPVSLIHSRGGSPIIDTLLTVHVPAKSSVVIDPTYELSGLPSFDVGWDGNVARDMIGETFDSNAGIILGNVDNNIVANDLIIIAPNADVNGKTDNGMIYLIKDINTLSGLSGLANTNNFSAAWGGSMSNDFLGRTSVPFFGPTGGGSGPGVQLLDVDGNGYRNDLLMTAVLADANGLVDNGAVYLIKDIDMKTGYYDLNDTNNSVAFTGAQSGVYLGFTALGGDGVKVGNFDGNLSANDLVITDANASFSGLRSGSVYVIMDINTLKSRQDLNNTNNFSYRFDGNTTSGDMLGSCMNSGTCVQIVNTDGNVYSNDLLITDSNWDSKSGAVDSGKVILIKDVNNISKGIKVLNTSANYSASWFASQPSATVGSTNGWGSGTQLFDLNGDGFVNDLVLTSYNMDVNSKTDNGAVYIIYDINRSVGDYNLDSNTTGVFTFRINGGAATDRIGSDTLFNQLGGWIPPKVQMINMDGNKTANDLVIMAPLADVNTLTNNGAMYIFMDVNTMKGNRDNNRLADENSFALIGIAANDSLGSVNSQSAGFDILNLDGNFGPNDVIVATTLADINGKTDAGAIYVVRDLNRFTKTSYIPVSRANAALAWNGGSLDFLGDTNWSGPPYIIGNTDGNARANDIIIMSPRMDTNNFTDAGAIFLFRDISDRNGFFDLNSPLHMSSTIKNFNWKWSGDKNFTMLGDTNRSGYAVLLTNINGSNADDLFIMAPRLDTAKTDVGGLYLIKDIALTDSNFQLDVNTNYSSLWRGDFNSDRIGENGTSNTSFLVVNTDGNSVANDLLILSARKDMNSLVDNGAVFLVKDIATPKTQYGVLTFRVDTPSIDYNSYVVGMDIPINVRVTCTIADCGDVDVNIQYCYGTTCTAFFDINTVNTSPLYISSGTNDVFTSSVKFGQGFDANYVLKAVDKALFSIRVFGKGTTALPSTLPTPYPAIFIEFVNSRDLLQGYNYSVRAHGGISLDRLGFTNQSGPSIQFVNIDDGLYANDLIISDPFADVNGRVDNGAIYLLKNIDLNSGPLDLNNVKTSYSAMWDGNSNNDRIGDTNRNGPGFMIVNSDGNSYTNDLLIIAPQVDVNGKTDAGAVYLIRDIDLKSGPFDLNQPINFAAMWTGGSAGEQLGNAAQTDDAVQLVNLDGNASANDLIISAAYCDVNSVMDAGCIYLVKDINRFAGRLDFNNWNNFSVRFNGGQNNDRLGSANVGFATQEAAGIQLVNTDGNLYSNDLLVTASQADNNGKLDVGAVYLIRDINARSGSMDLNLLTFSNFAVGFFGGAATDRLGFTATSDKGVQLVDIDGNEVTNDLLITAPYADVNGKTDNGAIYLIKDINQFANARFDLSQMDTPITRWDGNSNSDFLGDTNQSGLGVQLVNLDGNRTANDLVVTAPLADLNNVSNVGAVYLIKDINKSLAFTRSNDLADANNFNVVWYGTTASDQVGDSSPTSSSVVSNTFEKGTVLASIDGSSVTNDLIILAPLYDANSTADAGVVFLIKDINAVTQKRNPLSTRSHSSTAFIGASTTDRLGDSNRSGAGYLIGNVDNNAYSNDLLLVVPFGDLNQINTGGVYLFRDIDANRGWLGLGNAANYNVRFIGSARSVFLGSSIGSGTPIQMADLDGQLYSNDLIIHEGEAATGGKTFNGAVYLDQNIDSLSGTRAFASNLNYTYRWVGGRTNDYLGSTNFSGPGLVVVNADNGSSSNDLFMVSVFADVNNKTDNGAVYLIENVVSSTSVNYSFVVSLPSSGCTVGKGNISGGSTCQKGYIESTDTSGPSDSNQIAPEGQSAAVPFFVIDNQSTTSSDFNIFLDLNASLPASLVLKAGTASSSYQGQCSGVPSGCKVLDTTATSIGKAVYSAGSQDLNIWFWGDFIAASVGDVDRNVDVNAGAS